MVNKLYKTTHFCSLYCALLCLIVLSGCAISGTYNVIDITDDQWIEDAQGNRCIEKQMIINEDYITYFYEKCPIRRIVRPKVHILPKPVKPKCTDSVCSL